jgi:hypothetical protein
MESVMDAVANGSQTKCLIIVNSLTTKVIIVVAEDMSPGLGLTRLLDVATQVRGLPRD